MEKLQMRLDAEKQEHIAKLYKLAQVKGEKLDPESLTYKEVCNLILDTSAGRVGVSFE